MLIERAPYPLRRTMAAGWVHASLMQVEVGAQDVRWVAEHAAIIDTRPAHDRPVVCSINGQYIPRADWWQPVRAGDIIVWQELAGGGGNSNALRIVLLVALVVVANFYGAGLATTLGVSESTATGLITLAGTLAINALLPLPKPPTLGAGVGQSPSYDFALQGNRARPGEVVPVRYGHELVVLDYASLPYAEYDSKNDQYFCACLVLGLGVYEILSIQIDDTDIRNFQDVSLVRVGPSQAQKYWSFLLSYSAYGRLA